MRVRSVEGQGSRVEGCKAIRSQLSALSLGEIQPPRCVGEPCADLNFVGVRLSPPDARHTTRFGAFFHSLNAQGGARKKAPPWEIVGLQKPKKNTFLQASGGDIPRSPKKISLKTPKLIGGVTPKNQSPQPPLMPAVNRFSRLLSSIKFPKGGFCIAFSFDCLLPSLFLAPLLSLACRLLLIAYSPSASCFPLPPSHPVCA